MIANYHTHTWRCNHASGTEEEYVQAGLAARLQILGFSDHSPYLFPGEYYSGFRMRPEQLDGYVDTVLGLRERFAGQIDLPLGLELEFYPALLPQLLPVLRDRPIDYLLLGQHFVGNEMGEHYSGRPTADAGILRRYCHQSMEAMQSGLFTYFAHPDLICFAGDRSVYREAMGELCREAKACAVPLEINLLGIREGRNYPDSVFWELAAEEGNQVILGCDAHSPGALTEGKAEKTALELVKKLGLELLSQIPLRPIR